MTTFDEYEGRILRFLADQPGHACRMSWLPDDISFHAFCRLREAGHIDQADGPSGVQIVSLSASVKKALTKLLEGRKP